MIYGGGDPARAVPMVSPNARTFGLKCPNEEWPADSVRRLSAALPRALVQRGMRLRERGPEIFARTLAGSNLLYGSYYASGTLETVEAPVASSADYAIICEMWQGRRT